MPKPVHDLVDKLLADPDFYPEKSQKEQEAIAWAIAYSKYNKSKGKKSKASVDSLRTAMGLITYSKKLEAANHHIHADALMEIVRDLSETK